MNLSIDFKIDGEVATTIKVDKFEPAPSYTETLQFVAQGPLKIQGRQLDLFLRIAGHQVALQALGLWKEESDG